MKWKLLVDSNFRIYGHHVTRYLLGAEISPLRGGECFGIYKSIPAGTTEIGSTSPISQEIELISEPIIFLRVFHFLLLKKL